jgi:hypothetical protein
VLRTVIWDFAGQPAPERLLDDVKRLEPELRAGALRRELDGLLTVEEIDGTADRARALADVGRFPVPGPGRSRPWPAV